jgi:hypothetical protein
MIRNIWRDYAGMEYSPVPSDEAVGQSNVLKKLFKVEDIQNAGTLSGGNAAWVIMDGKKEDQDVFQILQNNQDSRIFNSLDNKGILHIKNKLDEATRYIRDSQNRLDQNIPEEKTLYNDLHKVVDTIADVSNNWDWGVFQVVQNGQDTKVFNALNQKNIVAIKNNLEYATEAIWSAQENLSQNIPEEKRLFNKLYEIVDAIADITGWNDDYTGKFVKGSFSKLLDFR